MSIPKLAARLLPWKHQTEKEQMAEIQAMFRRVFYTKEGAIVLSAILQDLGWNTKTTSPEAGALKNFATHLLQSRLGVTNDTLATITAILNSEIKETP
jgi:hypothetical protein